MADLTISFDPGASLSRVFFTLDSGQPELLLMEPYTALIPLQSLLDYEEDAIGTSSPEDSAWIEYNQQCWGVGFICHRFYADLKLEQPKFELAIYKTLAVVGAIAQKKSLPNGATICLGIFWAIAAFWHPIACRWLGVFSEADLKLKARTAIYQLQQQIIYLAQTFNLEQELETHGIVANPTNSLDAHLISSPQDDDDDRTLKNAFN